MPRSPLAGFRGVVSDYVELTKPNVTALILMSTAVGFCFGSAPSIDFSRLVHTLVGTALVASGTAALNEYWERDVDAKMRRTRQRPLPAARLRPWKALFFAIALSVAGVGYLAWQTNAWASLLALMTLLSYVFLYTPLKKRTPLCTMIGAFPGAIPPLLGCVAARGAVTPAGWILFAILFIWQFPHFLAIAWIYREDYARGRIAMLPVIEPDGKSTACQIMIACAALLPVSLLPSLFGLAGRLYLAGSLLCGIAFLYFGAQAALAKTTLQARRLLQATVIYLPLVYGLVLIDKVRPAP